MVGLYGAKVMSFCLTDKWDFCTNALQTACGLIDIYSLLVVWSQLSVTVELSVRSTTQT